MQYLMNVMSMVPKKEKGEFRMIAAMASGWRCDARLGVKEEGARNTHVVDTKDVAWPGSCCLHLMEDRHIFLDLLRALGVDTLQGLWGFIKFYETIDTQVLFTELDTRRYGHTKLAVTMLVHCAPMFLKLGKAVEGPIDFRGCGIVVGCDRSGSMARGLDCEESCQDPVVRLRRSWIQ